MDVNLIRYLVQSTIGSMLFALFFYSCVRGEDGYISNTIMVLDQKEKPYLNGRWHGEKLKNEIQLQVRNWEQGMKQYLGLNRDSIFAIVYEHTGFVKAIEKHTPLLLEEVNGIADGSGLDRRLVLSYNLGEEIYNYCSASIEQCSNMAICESWGNTIAYNQDLPEFLHGNDRVIVLKNLNQYVFSMPGCIALSGVSKEISISCNSLPMLKMNRNGLPLPFFIRQLLGFHSLTEARFFIHRTPLAVPQNILMVSASGVLNAEISRDTICWLEPKSNGLFYHTNFPLENANYKHRNYTSMSCNRFQFLDTLSVEEMSKDQVSAMQIMEQTFEQTPILNTETFLRYVASFERDQDPLVHLINPRSQEKLMISFSYE